MRTGEIEIDNGTFVLSVRGWCTWDGSYRRSQLRSHLQSLIGNNWQAELTPACSLAPRPTPFFSVLGLR